MWVNPRELVLVRMHDGMIVATGHAEPESNRTQPLYTIPQPPPGYTLVPVEPTEAMVKAGAFAQDPAIGTPVGGSGNANRLRRRAARVWKSMLLKVQTP